MQFKTNNPDIVIKWISYSQFDEIKEIGKGGFATIYSAILNDFKVALKCLDNSQNLIDELLNEVKAYKVVLNNSRLSRILKVYGISQDPDTRNYIIVLYYAEGGNFNNWININENYKCFNWQNKIRILYSISNGLKEIHEKQMVHRDFHTGNILFNTPFREEYANRIYISDMGLCGNVNDINRNNKNNIYGVMPYIAPEVLRGKPYTQAADIYSLGMIMHFVATGSQPFGNRAHDHNLVLDIYNEIRPEINEPEAPKSYIDLMKKCWDSNPENRPNITEFIESLRYISVSEIEEAENYRNLHLSTLKGDRKITTHSQAVYTSRLLNPFTECLDCAITD
ncbi:kinase-like domain-containing protein [Rhizophagus irregularis DAOM 181602=DAOM 197198]|nr:kinase-like domain-containing protein [Rhizophagus irregularis DAOM 181602=DAOM 197198]POG81703.1 kinase-like domain-containing protein [Rhizophagus irregularis DAOM 181602=DAOM 197198]|eukprot:XP_025188569.1 kinase-like domain-containing protein [Rhizophagus irregularis DAOM 181602=DAOM 197198]